MNNNTNLIIDQIKQYMFDAFKSSGKTHLSYSELCDLFPSLSENELKQALFTLACQDSIVKVSESASTPYVYIEAHLS